MTRRTSHPVVRLSDREYEKMVEAHRRRNRERAERQFDELLVGLHRDRKGQVTVRRLSAETGLSTGTLYRYLNRGWGKRGPLLTTALALQLRRE